MVMAVLMIMLVAVMMIVLVIVFVFMIMIMNMFDWSGRSRGLVQPALHQHINLGRFDPAPVHPGQA